MKKSITNPQIGCGSAINAVYSKMLGLCQHMICRIGKTAYRVRPKQRHVPLPTHIPESADTEKVGLLRDPWSCDTRPKDARQLFCSHAIHHADDTSNKCCNYNSKARKQPELYTDILLLTRCPAPLHSLCGTVIIVAYNCAGTSAGIAAGMLLSTGTMS